MRKWINNQFTGVFLGFIISDRYGMLLASYLGVHWYWIFPGYIIFSMLVGFIISLVWRMFMRKFFIWAIKYVLRNKNIKPYVKKLNEFLETI